MSIVQWTEGSGALKKLEPQRERVGSGLQAQERMQEKRAEQSPKRTVMVMATKHQTLPWQAL